MSEYGYVSDACCSSWLCACSARASLARLSSSLAHDLEPFDSSWDEAGPALASMSCGGVLQCDTVDLDAALDDALACCAPPGAAVAVVALRGKATPELKERALGIPEWWVSCVESELEEEWGEAKRWPEREPRVLVFRDIVVLLGVKQ